MQKCFRNWFHWFLKLSSHLERKCNFIRKIGKLWYSKHYNSTWKNDPQIVGIITSLIFSCWNLACRCNSKSAVETSITQTCGAPNKVSQRTIKVHGNFSIIDLRIQIFLKWLLIRYTNSWLDDCELHLWRPMFSNSWIIWHKNNSTA